MIYYDIYDNYTIMICANKKCGEVIKTFVNDPLTGYCDICANKNVIKKEKRLKDQLHSRKTNRELALKEKLDCDSDILVLKT